MSRMTAATQNFEWSQGEDLDISVTYKIDDVPVDLTGYVARMDLAPLGTPTAAASFFSFDSDGVDDPLDGAEDEITLSSEGLITVEIPRSFTLTDPVSTALESAESVKYKYDLFLRDAGGKQRKILKGEITIDRSITLWQ